MFQSDTDAIQYLTQLKLLAVFAEVTLELSVSLSVVSTEEDTVHQAIYQYIEPSVSQIDSLLFAERFAVV